ncbi:MAG: glycosyltransferase family 39 protein [bacterium]|nr:glycosyltransferase family 39 protein [bacterium]
MRRILWALLAVGVLFIAIGSSVYIGGRLPSRVWYFSWLLAPKWHGETAAGTENLGFILAGLYLLLMALVVLFFEKSPYSPFKWSTSRFLLFMLSLQMLLAVALIVFLPYQLTIDDRYYFSQAVNLMWGQEIIWDHSLIIAAGDNITAWWPMGYPIYLYLFFKLFGVHLWIGQVANLIPLLGITLFAFLFSRELFDRGTANRTTLALVILPSQLFYAIPLYSDLFFSFLVMVLLYLSVKKRSLANTLLMGVIFGFAVFTRSIALFFVIIFWFYQIRRFRQWKPALVQLVVMLVICEAILLPWQIRNYRVFGQFVPFDTHGGINLWLGNNPKTRFQEVDFSLIPEEASVFNPHSQLNEAEKDHVLTKIGLSYALSKPLETVINWPRKVKRLFISDNWVIMAIAGYAAAELSPLLLSAIFRFTDGFYYALCISFLLAAVFWVKKERLTPRVILVLGTISSLVIIYLPFFSDYRYHLPMMPLIALTAVVTVAKYKAK